MKTRKNIDRLYHDRLKDVETTPREDVWKNIAARLPQQEKKKRILPLWFKLAGTAAVLALLFSVGNILLRPSEIKNPVISTSFSSASEATKENLRNLNSVSTNFKENMYQTTLLLQSLIEDTKTEISSLREDANSPGKTQKTSPGSKGLFADIMIPPSEIISKNPPYTFEDYNTGAFNREEQQKLLSKESTGEKELKDLNLVASEEKESEDETTESLPAKRLSVSTTVAAVYFDNLGTGNSIGSQFNNNKSSGEVSVAYGVNIAYQLSEKVKIRSGINKVDLSLNTQDVGYTSAVNAIARGSEQVNFDSPLSPTPSGQLGNEATTFATSGISGELSQNMGFIEVPVEIEYAIIDKQVGLHLIGGASTLFLNDNMVTLHSPDAANNLGKAQNLNNVSFSTNIGFGIDYNISGSFRWNLEPIFKYQLETFDDAPGVKPYTFGIYSGFSFRF